MGERRDTNTTSNEERESESKQAREGPRGAAGRAKEARGNRVGFLITAPTKRHNAASCGKAAKACGCCVIVLLPSYVCLSHASHQPLAHALTCFLHQSIPSSQPGTHTFTACTRRRSPPPMSPPLLVRSIHAFLDLLAAALGCLHSGLKRGARRPASEWLKLKSKAKLKAMQCHHASHTQ
jgi:hypothetical protein